MAARFKTIIAILLFVSFVSPIKAFDNGHELYDASIVTKEMATKNAAEGRIHEFALWVRFATYVDGFIGGLQFARMFDSDLMDVCIEQGEPLKTARDAVRKYVALLSRADALKTDARMIVYLALSGRYPCN